MKLQMVLIPILQEQYANNTETLAFIWSHVSGHRIVTLFFAQFFVSTKVRKTVEFK